MARASKTEADLCLQSNPPENKRLIEYLTTFMLITALEYLVVSLIKGMIHFFRKSPGDV